MAPAPDQPSSRNPDSPALGLDDPRAQDPDPRKSSRELRSFVSQVGERAGLEQEEEAERLARATFRQLGERLSSGQARDLSGTLPAELATELKARQSGQARAFDKDELIDRVSGEVHSVDAERVEAQVRAVLSTLKQWAPPGQIDDTLAQLPAGLADLFG